MKLAIYLFALAATIALASMAQASAVYYGTSSTTYYTYPGGYYVYPQAPAYNYYYPNYYQPYYYRPYGNYAYLNINTDSSYISAGYYNYQPYYTQQYYYTSPYYYNPPVYQCTTHCRWVSGYYTCGC